MPGFHPEARQPAAQVSVGIAQLVNRIRALEARLTGLPLIPLPVTPPSTASTTATPMMSFLSIADESWTATIQVIGKLSNPAAAAGVLLQDVQGHRLDSAEIGDGQNVTLTAASGAPGPFTVLGYTSTGTLTLTLAAAAAAPWASTSDG